MTFNFLEFKKLVESNDSLDLALKYLKSELSEARTEAEKDQIFQSGYKAPRNGDSLSKDIYNMVHYAVMLENVELLQLLLDNGAAKFINDKEREFSNTALHKAVRSGKVEIVKILLANGADFNATGDWRKTVFHEAVLSKNVELLEFLLDKEAIEKLTGKEVIVTVNTPDYNNTVPFHKVSYSGDRAIAELLLRAGADFNAVDTWKKTVFHYIDQRINAELLEFLVDKEAIEKLTGKEVTITLNTPDDIGRTPLSYIARHKEVVKLFLQAGAEVNAVDNGGRTIFHYAVQLDGGIEVLELLLDKEAIKNLTGQEITVTVNTSDKNGATPFCEAARHGNKNAMKLFLQEGADFNVVDNEGSTVFHHARPLGKTEALEFLLDKKSIEELTGREVTVTVNTPDKNGATPLCNAARNWGEKAIELFLQAGADFNAIDHQGNTVFHHASQPWNTDGVLEFLLDKKAIEDLTGKKVTVTVNTPNKEGKTAFDVAKEGDHQAVVDLYIANGYEVAGISIEGNDVLEDNPISSVTYESERFTTEGSDRDVVGVTTLGQSCLEA